MKDIKYIIKRVIIGLILGIIFMLFGKYGVLAEQIGTISNINIHDNWHATQTFTVTSAQTNTSFYETELATNPPLKNMGKGFIIFSLDYWANGKYQPSINGVSIKSGSSLSACEIGNTSSYSDNNVMHNVMSIKCYVNLGSSGIERIRFQSPYRPTDMGVLAIYLSRYMTFVGSPSPTSNQDIINSITTTSNQQIQLEQQQISNQQQIIQQQQQTNEKLDNIDNTLNNDEPADDNSLGALDTGNLPGSSGPLSSLMTLPITIIDIFLSNARGACNDLSVPIPFINQNLTIPCVSRLFTELGWSSYYDTFGYLAGGLLMLKYLIYLYDRLSNLLYLEDRGLLGKVA